MDMLYDTLNPISPAAAKTTATAPALELGFFTVIATRLVWV
jgi:hypothetical protein